MDDLPGLSSLLDYGLLGLLMALLLLALWRTGAAAGQWLQPRIDELLKVHVDHIKTLETDIRQQTRILESSAHILNDHTKKLDDIHSAVVPRNHHQQE